MLIALLGFIFMLENINKKWEKKKENKYLVQIIIKLKPHIIYDSNI